MGYVTSVAHPSVCVGRVDPSSATNPRVIYVSASSTSDGDGSFENPFNSLRSTFLQLRSLYIDIVLLDGVHYLQKGGLLVPSQMITSSFFQFSRVTIDSFDCRNSLHCQAAIIERPNGDYLPFFFLKYAELIISNVTFRSPKRPASGDGAVLFSMFASQLRLRNVAFVHFDQVIRCIIRATDSEIDMENVDFIGISLDNAQILSKALIFSESFAKVRYSKGTVSLLNSNYDYTGLFAGGFLCFDAGELFIEHVVFEYNLVDARDKDFIPVCQSLIGLHFCFACEIRNSTFRNNIGFQGTALLYASPTWQTQSYVNVQKMKTSVFLISDCVFQNNTSTAGSTLAFSFIEADQKVTIRNCSFLRELSSSSTLTVNSTTGAGSGVFELSYVLFERVRALDGAIAVHTFPSLLFADVVILESGSTDSETVYSTSLDAFKSIPETHVPEYPTDIWQYSCKSLVTITRCESAVLTDFRVEAQRCALAFFSTDSEVQFLRARFLGNPGASLTGSVVSIHSASAAALRQVTVSSNTNDYLGGLGIVFLEADEATLVDCAFRGNRVYTGGVVYFASVLRVSVQNSSFEGNTATSGAVVFVNAPTEYLSRIAVVLCRFEGNSGSSGVLDVSSQGVASTVLLSVSTSLFRTNTGKQSSVLFWSESVALGSGSRIHLSQFISNEAAKGGVLYVDRTSGGLSISDSEFTGNVGGEGAILFFRCVAGRSECTIGLDRTTLSANRGKSIIDVTDFTRVQASELLFRANFGTGVLLEAASFEGINCLFSENKATSGAALRLISASASFSASAFQSNTADFVGGACAIENYSQFVCQTCVFRNNSSGWQGGALSVEQHSQVKIDSCTFRENKALDSGFSLYLFMNDGPSQVTNSDFEENEGAGYGSIFLLSAVLSMRNCTLRRNKSQRLMGGLVLHLSQAEVSDTLFRNQTGLMGSFIYVYHSSATIDGCSFAEGVASTAGGAVIAITSSLTVLNSSFTRLASPLGAAASLQSGSVVRMQQCVFAELASAQRGVLAVDSSALSLDSCRLWDYAESGVLATESNLTVRWCVFQNATAALGAGINCASCATVEVGWSRFEHLQAGGAAALYLWGTQQARWAINNSEFIRNVGEESGAVVLADSSAGLSHNLFEGNDARGLTGSGGALTLLSPQSSSLFNNTFTSNRAVRSGGGVFWAGSEPSFVLTAFAGNAAFYGPNVASHAIRLAVEFAANLTEVASGHRGEQRIAVHLLDHYGQIVSTDNWSFAQLTSRDPGTVFAGLLRVQAVEGRYVFEDFAVISAPGGRTSITLNSTGIEEANSTFPSVELQVTMRLCQAGESNTSGVCFVCTPGTYSLDPAEGCKNCPPEAECLGNYTMLPKKGYWRSSPYSEKFFVCPNPTACLGSLTGLTGECAEGYWGNKCQSCDTDHFASERLYCSNCPSAVLQVVMLVCFSLSAAVLLLLIVWSVLRGSPGFLRIKVFIDYVQLVMLASSINLSWPRYMLSFLTVQEAFGAFPEFILSLPCFHAGESEEQRYYRKLALVSACPPALLLLASFVWLGVAAKRSLSGVKNELACSAVVLFFLTYPSVVRVALGVFRCEEISDGESWVVGVQARCWSPTHLKFAFSLALPCALLVGLAIPLLLCVLVVRSREEMRGSASHLRYQFLLHGYTAKQRCWEFVVVGRKLLVILIVGFASSVGASVQSAGALTVLLISLASLHHSKPFSEPSIQALDVRSHLLVLVTLYSGLLYYANLLNEAARIALFVMVVLINSYFAVLCFKSAVSSVCAVVLLKVKSVCKKPPERRYRPSQLDVFEDRSHHNRMPDALQLVISS